jgi:O-antigen/teichoic acid export membrane protein
MLATAVKKINSKLGKDKDFKEIAKGGSLSFIINIIGIAFGYLFVFLVSKIYGSESASIYGKYVLVTLLLRVGSILTRSGTDTAMLKFTAAFASKGLWLNVRRINKQFLIIIFILGFIVSLVVIFGAKFWGNLLKLPPNIIIVSGFFITPMALGLYYSQSLRGLKKIGISSFLRTSALTTLNFLLLPLLLLFIPKTSPFFVDLPSYTFFAAIILTSIIGVIGWYRHLPPLNDDVIFDNSHNKTYKDLFQNSYPLLLVESMLFIGTWIDQLMLGIMGTNEGVGIFNVCVKYAMVASLSLQAVNTISAPKFSEYFFNKDYKNLAKNFRSTTKMIFWTTFPIVAAFIVFPHFFLNLFGKSFNTGSLALILLGIGSLISVMTGSVGVLLQMTGHQKIIQKILLISVITEIALNALLIPLYGVTGAAIASMIGTAMKNFSLSYFVKKYFGFTSIYFPLLKKNN